MSTLPQKMDKLFDYHVHIERGPYTFEWLDRFIETAQKRNIKEIGIVEHTHRFKEFAFLYNSVIQDNTPLGQLQSHWLSKRLNQITIPQYSEFFRKAKDKGYPIKFGLEVCYFPGYEEETQKLINPMEVDFVIGSLHWINGWGFDLLETSQEWQRYDSLELTRLYNRHLLGAINSGLFDIVGHIDCIKAFSPWKQNEWLLDEIAQALQEKDLCVEINTGIKHRKLYYEPCPSELFLKKCLDNQIGITLASDAHEPDDVGNMVEEAFELAKKVGYQEIYTFDNREKRLSKF